VVCPNFGVMNAVKLSPYYRLYAFPDYGSMQAALPYMRGVVMAKALAEVEAADARRYVWRSDGYGYRNYLNPIAHGEARLSVLRSLITALQLLYKSNGYSARYIVIERV